MDSEDMMMADSRRYWLMALGEESKHWESCHAERVACIDWVDGGDLRRYTKDELKREMGMNDALLCWEFCRVMKPGDVIFVKRRTTLVLGHGVVMSDYRFEEVRRAYQHVRDVEWLSRTVGVKPGERKLAVKTLTDITEDPDQVADLKRALNIKDRND